MKTNSARPLRAEYQPTPAPAPEPVHGWRLFILVLSIYVLGELFVEATVPLAPEVINLLEALDTAICFIFLGDFFYRLWRAPNKAQFLKWGWIDFISSIPELDLFRWGRMFVVVRIFHVLRAVRSTKVLAAAILSHRASGFLASVLTLTALVLIFSSIAILNVETSPAANIKSGSDALWWAISTVTTVGYGDRYPVTDGGRIIGVLLMFTGITLYGGVSAYLGRRFLFPDNNAQFQQLSNELRDLRAEILEARREPSSKPGPPIAPDHETGAPPQDPSGP